MQVVALADVWKAKLPLRQLIEGKSALISAAVFVAELRNYTYLLKRWITTRIERSQRQVSTN